jgi:hypothetical protein
MGFLDSLKSMFGGDSAPKQEGYWIYVRCRRCGEVIKTRLDLLNALSPMDEGGYMIQKTLVGSGLCFQRIEATLTFDDNRRLIDQSAVGGEFITAEQFETASAKNEKPA